ncbi:MAG: hypothetical protein ACXW04_07720 [Methylobacter sp.]
MRIPIQRLNQSRRRKNIADRAIDLGIAFEALYLNDRSSTEQISFTFRLRAAWHLGGCAEYRKMLIKMFKMIYELRSKAVHTGKIDQEVKLNKKTISTTDFLNQADSLCVQSIRKIINDSHYPDWESVILG